MDRWSGFAELFDEYARKVAEGRLTLTRPSGSAVVGEWGGAMRTADRFAGVEGALTLLLESGRKARVAIRAATPLGDPATNAGVSSVVLSLSGSGPAPF